MVKLKNNFKKKIFHFLTIHFIGIDHKFCQTFKPDELKHAMSGVAFASESPARNILEQPNIPGGLQKDRASLSTIIHWKLEMLRKDAKNCPWWPLWGRRRLYMARWPLGEFTRGVYLTRGGLAKVSSPCQELWGLKEKTLTAGSSC